MSKNQKPPEDLCQWSAREASWCLTEELTVEELRAHDITIATSIIQHGQPEFYHRESGEFANAKTWLGLVEQQKIRVFAHCWRIPPALAPEDKVFARELREFIADYLSLGHMLCDDCVVFRDPVHQGQFENIDVPDIAVMAVIYDGGPVAPFLNLSYEDYKANDVIDAFIKSKGYWCEAQTHWWSWIYKGD